jgi:hypothetical protein
MVNSTPAMVLPVRSWMIPAISWTIPPDISATAKTIGVTPSFTRPMLIALSMNVGTANAASASGPEFPQPVSAGDAGGGGLGGEHRLCAQHRIHFFEGFLACDAARLNTSDGEPDEALGLFAEAIQAFHRAGNVSQLIITLASVPALFERLDRLEPTAMLLGAGLDLDAAAVYARRQIDVARRDPRPAADGRAGPAGTWPTGACRT